MKSTTLAVSLGAALTNALAIRDGGCQFHISADGDISGPVGQISSGQVRAGKGLDAGTFTQHGDTIYDSKGHGCWWTPPSHVLQCDENQVPDKGFVFDCDGTVSYNGQKTFYECQTGAEGQYNIYLEPNKGQNCGKVTLKADGCHKDCAPAPPSLPPPPPAHKACPANLNGQYEFPHLIVPVDKSKPDTAAGTSYNGQISPDVSSIFNFDIPQADEGKTCSLVFLLPKKEDLETSNFSLTGGGGLGFSALKSPAKEDTTFNNQPGQAKDLGTVKVSPGGGYTIATFDCPAGKTVAYEIKSADGTKLTYFQDYNPSPIGLYITKC